MNNNIRKKRAVDYIIATMNYEGRTLSKETIMNCESVIEGKKTYQQIIREIKEKYQHSI